MYVFAVIRKTDGKHYAVRSEEALQRMRTQGAREILAVLGKNAKDVERLIRKEVSKRNFIEIIDFTL